MQELVKWEREEGEREVERRGGGEGRGEERRGEGSRGVEEDRIKLNWCECRGERGEGRGEEGRDLDDKHAAHHADLRTQGWMMLMVMVMDC